MFNAKRYELFCEFRGKNDGFSRLQVEEIAGGRDFQDLFLFSLISVTYPEIWRCEQISRRRCGRFPMEMYHLL
jgi:hypothetical protein